MNQPFTILLLKDSVIALMMGEYMELVWGETDNGFLSNEALFMLALRDKNIRGEIDRFAAISISENKINSIRWIF